MISYRFRPYIARDPCPESLAVNTARGVNEIPITNCETRLYRFFLHFSPLFLFLSSSRFLPHPTLSLPPSLPFSPYFWLSSRVPLSGRRNQARGQGNILSGQRTIPRNPKIETSPLKAALCFPLKVQRLARGTSDLGMHENHALEPLDRGPYFDVSASRNVTALVGKTATLSCRVRNLGDRTVRYLFMPKMRISQGHVALSIIHKGGNAICTLWKCDLSASYSRAATGYKFAAFR